MFAFDPQAVLLNARKATTEDLLDQVTAYREGMEPEAIPIFEAELWRRGVGPEVIARRREESRQEHLYEHGTALKCSFCEKPAVAQEWGWHRLRLTLPVIGVLIAPLFLLGGRSAAGGDNNPFSGLPIFPRFLRLCEEHRAKKHPPA